MAEIKFTKSELRAQQNRFSQLQKYLPTLQLKKAMLQIEVNEARLEISKLAEEFQHLFEKMKGYSALLSEDASIDLLEAVKVIQIHRYFENIAGVEVPYLKKIDFQEYSYSLYDTPIWTETVIQSLRSAVEAKLRIDIAIEKKGALEKELREVSIRVNLFEKILIPRALQNIKKIKVFLSDQQLAAVSQAKVAKAKILKNQFEIDSEKKNEASNAN